MMLGVGIVQVKNKRYMTLYFKLMYRKVAFGHKKVVTVSKFSKDRISKILKKNPDEIAVIYDGLSDCFANFYYDKEQDMKAKEPTDFQKGIFSVSRH